DPERVDVEARVGLVEDGEGGIEDAHLHHLGALLLAAREADVHGALEHVHVELEQPGLLARQLEEFTPRKKRLIARRTLRVERFTQELNIRNARNLDRILEP